MIPYVTTPEMTPPLCDPEKVNDRVFEKPAAGVKVRCSPHARLPGGPVSTHVNVFCPQHAGPEPLQLGVPDTEIEFSVTSS